MWSHCRLTVLSIALIMGSYAPATASENSPEVLLFTDKKSVTLILLNPFDEPVEYIDSFNLGGDGPIGVYFMISPDYLAADEEVTNKWIRPQNYNSWALVIPQKPVVLEPNSFVKKSWPIDDLVRPTLICDESISCKRLLKFRVRALTKEAVQKHPPPTSHFTVETPWAMYELPNE